MTKVLFLIKSLEYGGAERQLVELAKGLNRKGHPVTVAVFYPGGPLEPDLAAEGIPVLSLDKRGRWEMFGFFWRLIRLVRGTRPEIIHGYLTMSNILTVLIKGFFPGTRVVWGLRASNMDLDEYDWLERLTSRLERWLAPGADLVIANSNAGRDYAISKGFPKDKILVIPNGLDTNRFRPDPEAGRRVREEWGVGDRQKLIGLVARLDPMKDHSTFLQAAARLAAERQEVKFVCVGDGPEEYRRRLLSFGRELGLGERLIWAGARGDMPVVYNAFDIGTLSSSFGEGFPNVVAEAMACGVPCVVTDVGDSAWIVGDTGFVAPPKNPEALAAGWVAALNLQVENPALAARRARDRIVANFGSEKLAERTSQALEALRADSLIIRGDN